MRGDKMIYVRKGKKKEKGEKKRENEGWWLECELNREIGVLLGG